MSEKRRLFIYDRKEVGVLILLGIAVALFAFTLGVHLGKQVIPKTEIAKTDPGSENAPATLDPSQPEPPNRTEIANEVGNVPAAVDETLDESLRNEVAKTGLIVEKAKPLSLPDTPVAKSKSESKSETRSGSKYVLQVGSYPSLKEAEPQVTRLNEKGLRAEIREVNLRGKGKWYRVFVGAYSTVAEAEKAGQTFRSEQRIGDFVVVNPQASQR